MKARVQQYREFDFKVEPVMVELKKDGEEMHVVWPKELESK
jgi:hypothetical protein